MPQLRELSEAELVAKATSRQVKWVRSASTAVALALIAGVPWRALRGESPGAGWLCTVPLLAFAGLMIGALLHFGVLHLLGGKRYQLELLRRAGWKPFAERLAEARDAGNATLLLTARALPHGGEHQVVLSERNGGWWLTATSLKPLLSLEEEDPRGALRVAEGPVAPLEEVPDDLSGEPVKPVIDGIPFTLHVLRRPPRRSYEVSGNLAAGCRDARTAALVTRLLDLAQAAGTKPALYGSTDAHGNIELGER